jgi:cyclohexadienyl dehydratase
MRAHLARSSLCTALFFFALAACRSEPAAQGTGERPDPPNAGPAERAPAAAAEQPVMRVGTSGDYAPFSKAGAGFDVELAARMFADLGYQVTWVPFAWPELSQCVAANAFDVAMSGVTWRPERSVVGYMTRAIASGGPCVLGRAAPGTVAVNRGGVLERWARDRFRAAQVRTVDDNLALPGLLERGEVDAIVTDSFELTHFARAGASATCDPPRDRKVYWVSPAHAAALGPRIDRWLAEHGPELRAMRQRFLGTASDWTDLQHLVDLLARRLALMPAVAAYKRAHGLPLEDAAREAAVLQRTEADAAALGLDPASVRALFAELIALAKAIQLRTGDEAAPLDLDRALRPEISALGGRILSALAACARELPRVQAAQLDLLVPLLRDDERSRLLAALRGVRMADAH